MRLTYRKLGSAGFVAVLAAFTLTYAGSAAPLKAGHVSGKFVVHEAVTLQISTIDGIMSNSVESTHQIYPSLVQISGQGGLVPDMATSWTNTPDGKTWTFQIRKGVKNADGTPLTAQDIVWTFQTVLATPTSLVRQNIANYMTADSISASADGSTITFNLTNAMATWPRQTSLVPLVSQAEYTKIGAAGFATHPVGAGPYGDVVGFNPATRLVLHANKYYYKGQPTVSYVTEEIIGDETTRENALKTGEIDAATLSPITAADAATDKKLKVVTIPGSQVFFLGYNVNQPQLQSPKLRQAIGVAIDRAAIAKSIYNGGTVPSYQMLAPVTFGYNPQQPVITYDVNAAKQLVQQSGYSGQTLTLTYPTGTLVAGADQLAQAIQGYLGAAGIQVNLVAEDSSTFLADWLGKRLPGIYLMSFQPSTLDGALVYNLLMHSANYATDANAESLFQQQAAQPNVKQRHDLMVQLGQALINSDQWFTPLLLNGRVYAWNPSKVKITPRADGYLQPQFFKRPGQK